MAYEPVKLARFILGQIGAVEVAFAGRLLAIGLDRTGAVGRCEPFDKGMLGGDDHVGGAEKRVGAGGVYSQDIVARLAGEAVFFTFFLPILKSRVVGGGGAAIWGVHGLEARGTVADEEIDFGAGAAANPIALQGP